MNRRTQILRARMAACASYWRMHVAIRRSYSAPCTTAIPALYRQPRHKARPTNHKPGPAACIPSSEQTP